MRSIVVSLGLFCVLAGTARAETIQLGPNVYRITEGVQFSIANDLASSFVFAWSDATGNFSAIADPTLILQVEQTYTFRRTTASHPFIITDDTLPVTGSDGNYQRTTFEGSTLDAATLDPVADFTADPAPTADLISWTPSPDATGTYWYTCRVNTHAGMTGRITVEDTRVPTAATTWTRIKNLFRN